MKENAISTQLPESKCAGCGRLLDQASARGGTPVEGDICVCIDCGELHVFQADLTLQHVTPEMLEAYPEETKARMIRAKRITRGMKNRRVLDSMTGQKVRSHLS